VPNPDVPKPWLGQRIYNFLYRFFGPAELGSFDEPETAPADETYHCPVCGHPMSEHEYTTTAGRRRMTCPAPPLTRNS